jgi:hypothetical protein
VLLLFKKILGKHVSGIAYGSFDTGERAYYAGTVKNRKDKTDQ